MDNMLPPNVPVYWISMLVILAMILGFLGYLMRIIVHLIIHPLVESINKLDNSVQALNASVSSMLMHILTNKSQEG